MKIGKRLRRLAEADLVRHDNAIAAGGERLDGRAPIARRKIPAMQQERGAAICLADRRHVHIGHVQGRAILPLDSGRDHEHVYRVGVGKTLKPNAKRLFGQRR